MAKLKNNVAGLLLGLAIFLSSAAFAHEGGKHFLGHVKSIDKDALTIVTTTNETVTIKVVPTTKFMKGNQAASLQDLKAGERVAIHAKQNGKSWEAEEVHFGASSPRR